MFLDFWLNQERCKSITWSLHWVASFWFGTSRGSQSPFSMNSDYDLPFRQLGFTMVQIGKTLFLGRSWRQASEFKCQFCIPRAGQDKSWINIVSVWSSVRETFFFLPILWESRERKVHQVHQVAIKHHKLVRPNETERKHSLIKSW